MHSDLEWLKTFCVDVFVRGDVARLSEDARAEFDQRLARIVGSPVSGWQRRVVFELPLRPKRRMQNLKRFVASQSSAQKSLTQHMRIQIKLARAALMRSSDDTTRLRKRLYGRLQVMRMHGKNMSATVFSDTADAMHGDFAALRRLSPYAAFRLVRAGLFTNYFSLSRSEREALQAESLADPAMDLHQRAGLRLSLLKDGSVREAEMQGFLDAFVDDVHVLAADKSPDQKTQDFFVSFFKYTLMGGVQTRELASVLLPVTLTIWDKLDPNAAENAVAHMTDRSAFQVTAALPVLDRLIGMIAPDARAHHIASQTISRLISPKSAFRPGEASSLSDTANKAASPYDGLLQKCVDLFAASVAVLSKDPERAEVFLCAIGDPACWVQEYPPIKAMLPVGDLAALLDEDFIKRTASTVTDDYSAIKGIAEIYGIDLYAQNPGEPDLYDGKNAEPVIRAVTGKIRAQLADLPTEPDQPLGVGMHPVFR
ncbi:MAG: hypothetical protein H6865_02655 [Rhodospirillales bacterium]|nr:hypothetical protein [Alphaproteobacteria bacterium]MCB9986517.1 hypothetical protein [Rhodospirillales bacterium]USO06946.1 MAG: hypothetical protein H6866_05730 [Rhodospirillales bacterium]